jgi:hypothetical protein
MIPKTSEPADSFDAAFARLHASAEIVRQELQKLEEKDVYSLRLVIGSSYQALKRCVGADGLSPSAREQVRDALRMCAAELGLEHS